MKNCPVCKTAVFDDMDVCYGCMHRFSVLELEGGSMLRIENGAELEAGFEAASVREIEKGGSDELSSSEPPRLEELRGTWLLRVELRDPREPRRSWTVELAPPSGFAEEA